MISKSKQTFTKGEISSVNLLTGRVGVNFRNGLKSTASYIGDVKDLRTGMSVLVGKVNNTYVIINKISNVTRTGTSLSLSKPELTDAKQLLILNFNILNILILNFEGNYIDETYNSSVHEVQNVSIDTSWSKFGSSSLLLGLTNSRIVYEPIICSNGDLSAHCYIKLTKSPTKGKLWPMEFYSYETGACVYFSIQKYEISWGGDGLIRPCFMCSDGDDWYDLWLSPFVEGGEYHIAFSSKGRNFLFFLNGNIVGSHTFSKDNPLSLMDEFDIACSDATDGKFQVDAVEVIGNSKWTSNFTLPTTPPAVKWIEEAQGLTPLYQTTSILTTTQSKFGNSSLRCRNTASDDIIYVLPNAITGDFTWHGWLQIVNVAYFNEEWPAFWIVMSDTWGSNPSFLIYQQPNNGGRIRVKYRDKNGVLVYDFYIIGYFTYTESYWHHIALIVHGRNILFAIDGQIFYTHTSEFDNPLAGINTFIFDRNVSSFVEEVAECRWDAWELVSYAKWKTNFTPPTHAPVKGVITV